MLSHPLLRRIMPGLTVSALGDGCGHSPSASWCVSASPCFLWAWGAPVGLALLSFAVGGAIWAPYMPTSMALLQRSTTAANRSEVLAANGAVTVVSVPAGTILGGPLVIVFGARQTLLICAAAIITFGVVAATVTASRHRLREVTQAS